MAGLAATVWIPAFAGMTGATNSKTYPCKPMKGEGIRWRYLYLISDGELG